MKPIYTHFAGALALTFGIAACVPGPRPAPPVQARPTPAPAPAPAPAPIYHSWLDVPQTPGDWSYRPQQGGGIARFGTAASEPRFAMRCEASARAVVLTRYGAPAGTAQMTIRSESQTRTLSAASSAGAAGTATARLAANDRLLDAMALSKGRFAVEVPGASPLYLPSWAEVTRVIEDCR